MPLIPKDKDLGWTPFAWLIYIVPFTLTPLYRRRFDTPEGWLLFLAATAVFMVLYFRSYWVRGRELILVACATLAMGVAFWPVSAGAGGLFIYAAAMIGTLERASRAIAGVGIIALIAVAEGLALRQDWFNVLWPVVFTLLIGAINIHFSQVNRSNARLRLAQEEIEHLAKVAERERIARDLHDVLGHTLSLIVLKSELAAKLSERDPARAHHEIRDVELISREALAEVRAAVAGYRAGTLASEAEHARSVLASAAIAVDCEIAPAQVPPSQEAVLSLALREAVTNIVRHSGARRCTIRFSVADGACVLTVNDDGRGGHAPFGNGLSGMHERVKMLGGSLARDGRRGTILTVTLPLSGIEERTA